ncbi:MAG TPA: hypothetical protein VK469_10240 [Candidatus Kapabacteria bacterium]|nr:hypothetical protein [Candidatus Kapabacteria bacterium]
MNKYHLNLHQKMIIGIIFLLVLNLQVFPVIFGNGSGNGYCDWTLNPDCPLPPGFYSTDTRTGYGIEALVKEGGGYFLNAHSSTLALLIQIEMSDLQGIDYDRMKKNAADALQNIRAAVSIYNDLVEIAANTPYNTVVIDKLKTFDYQTFMDKNKLNREIFKKVVVYLSSGDINGMYCRILKELTALEKLLSSITNDIAFNRQPGLSLLWKTNETFSETLLFGQYAARVFYAL